MFERFTAAARSTVTDARAHARRLGHAHAGTEHILLALTSSKEPVGATLRTSGLTPEVVELEIAGWLDRDRAALASIGIDLNRVREIAEATFGPDALEESPRSRWPHRRRRHRRAAMCAPSSGSSRVAWGPRAKKSLELSLREALRLKSGAIAPEHILLGILREGEGLACAVLVRRGVSFTALRTTIEASLRQRA